ncbi:unnamed protein product [Aphanomyces euteiches]|uniref:Uncharacterized protein n=1 Tax=Aphanomyces euteiches TaxID=100861 RepID=A0A6G0X8B1_9STRA|nr:hypothetical protein Ae201684_007335 [Aphanomyces euteiches]KAH9081348.1 hypothetical protein LEN26_021339 [Aphanomyces euteiches]KAH9101103.1 hypothetical protein Ae201684P_007290 [Aphanomyces euteiches]KAH9103252.1 hypothetical protein AeMF1_020390 [Aphanomyces euteiches]KAH9140933.1 hypothetical protein AeRB84_014855 [Aphanomyces euteiches]
MKPILTPVDQALHAPYAVALDHNQLIVGKWKTDILGCMMDDVVPNCLMSTFCPCVALAQVTHRVGMYKYWKVLVSFAALVLLFIFVVFLQYEVSNAFVVAMWAVLFVALLLIAHVRRQVRQRFQIPGSSFEDVACSCFFSFCVIGQMAIHVEAYTPNVCSIRPKDTLPGYHQV